MTADAVLQDLGYKSFARQCDFNEPGARLVCLICLRISRIRIEFEDRLRACTCRPDSSPVATGPNVMRGISPQIEGGFNLLLQRSIAVIDFQPPHTRGADLLRLGPREDSCQFQA